MNKWKNIIFLMIALLLLELCKMFMSKTGFRGFYFFSMIAVSLQFFLGMSFILLLLVKKIIGNKLGERKKNIVAVLILLSFLSSAELLFGFWLNNPAHIPKIMQWSYWFYYDYYDCRLIQFQKGASVYDSSLFYRLNPHNVFNYENREFNDSFSVNRAGLRDRDSSLTAPAIICLGDSYTLGWGVKQEETFGEQLEMVSGMRVLNAGISSYGTMREMRLLNFLDISSLRYVIIQYCSNDIIENEAGRNNNYKLKISSSESFDSLQTEHAWVRKYFPGKFFFTISQLFLKHQLNKIFPFFKLRLDRQNPVTNEEKHALYFLDVLCNTEMNTGNAKIIVTMLDSYPHLKNNFLLEVERLVQREPYKSRLGNKLMVADVMPVLDPNDFYLLDLHIKASGHKKIADVLWGKIKGN